ncbi:MAG TPA: alpha/beta fold hydrolase [Steroidobacteraceae bacterium]
MPSRTKSTAQAPGPRVRRAYFDCRFGQLHVRHCMPAGGGFEEATTLLCIHPSPQSGRIFNGLLPLLGLDRSVYAPDLPGFGESDPPPAAPGIADYAAAVGDFLDSMRFRQIDVLGYQGGSLIASELAIVRPQLVRRVVLIGVPLPSDAERAAFRLAPWPLPPAQDGGHLATEWQRTLQAGGPRVTLELLAASFATKLYNGPHAWWGEAAALNYPVHERLPLITQPTLVLRPKDVLWEPTARAGQLLRHANHVDLAQFGAGLLEAAPESVARCLKDFLAR